jgi:hypothetical protein
MPEPVLIIMSVLKIVGYNKISMAVFDLNTSRNTRVGFLNKTPRTQHACQEHTPRFTRVPQEQDGG